LHNIFDDALELKYVIY